MKAEVCCESESGSGSTESAYWRRVLCKTTMTKVPAMPVNEMDGTVGGKTRLVRSELLVIEAQNG